MAWQRAILAAVSRKLAAPPAVLVQSSSEAGKSSLMDAVLERDPFWAERQQVVNHAIKQRAGAFSPCTVRMKMRQPWCRRSSGRATRRSPARRRSTWAAGAPGQDTRRHRQAGRYPFAAACLGDAQARQRLYLGF
jgi:hypothetical protein